MFQFHSGSIKSENEIADPDQLLSFNSIVVRLKGGHENWSDADYLGFQFHSGSIKSQRHRHFQRRIGRRFNSIVVRLKATYKNISDLTGLEVSIP